MCASIVLCSVYYTVSCVEVKIEPDSDDATECPRADKPMTGMLSVADYPLGRVGSCLRPSMVRRPNISV